MLSTTLLLVLFLAAEEVPAPAPISAKEPLAKEFSAAAAARSLDVAALHWQATRKCGTCHTNFAYLMARPALAAVSPPAGEVRIFFEEMVRERWPKVGPRWPAEVVAAATTLAMNDRATTGKLHPLTRTALDRACSLQRPDGSWDWLKCGWPPMESDDHFGVTFAALGIALAPEGYAETATGRKSLEGIRGWLKANPAPSLHHRAMVLWASLHVEGLMTGDERKKTLEALFRLQRPEGGWAVAGLLDGWKEHRRQDQEPQDLESPDGYATGFVIYLARQAGIPASDERLQRGVGWLKRNQRESGRWFTRSPTLNNQHFLSNYGTAFAVMALAACGELPGSPKTAEL